MQVKRNVHAVTDSFSIINTTWPGTLGDTEKRCLNERHLVQGSSSGLRVKNSSSPQCGSVGWASFWEPKGLHSWFLAGGTCLDWGTYGRKAADDVSLSHRCFLPSLSPSLPLSLKSKIKYFLRESKIPVPILSLAIWSGK